MMRHGEHQRVKDKPRVLWHTDAPPDVRQPPSLALPEIAATAEAGVALEEAKLKPSPMRSRITKFKEPQPSEQELEIIKTYEAKAQWRTPTWERNDLDARLEAAKSTEVERFARRPKTPEEPTWKGVVEAPPGKNALSLRMYSQIADMVYIQETEKPVDMDRPKGLPFHGEELKKLRERERARRRAAAEHVAGGGEAPKQRVVIVSPKRGGRASASPTMTGRRGRNGASASAPRTPTKQARDGRPSPLILSSPNRGAGTPQSRGSNRAQTPQTPEEPEPAASPTAAQRGARTKLKVAAIMGIGLQKQRQEQKNVVAKGRWKTAGLLAKKKSDAEKQAANRVNTQVAVGAMVWKKQAAARKEAAAAEAARGEQAAKNKAMFAAAVAGDAEVVVMALREGAEVEARNAAGLTVAKLCLERKRGNVIRAIAAYIREVVDGEVKQVWDAYTAHLGVEGEGEIGEPTPGSSPKKSAMMLWKKAREMADPNPIATAAAKAAKQAVGGGSGSESPTSGSPTAVRQAEKAIHAALERAQPVLNQLEALEVYLSRKASQEQSKDIVSDVLETNRKKLSRMRKWKKKLEIAERRRKEKEDAWNAELQGFRDAANRAESKKVAREKEKERVERAEMERLKEVERKRLAAEVKAKENEAARQTAMAALDKQTPGTPGTPMSASGRILSGMSSRSPTPTAKMASPLAAAKMRRVRRASLTAVMVDGPQLQAPAYP